jgi:uncharacterized membrane protein YidH (DUF202 family)
LGDGDDPKLTAIASFVTAICVALSVYAKTRWEEAKEQKAKKNGVQQ